VKRLAEENGISPAELESMQASKSGRLSRSDIEEYLKKRQHPELPAAEKKTEADLAVFSPIRKKIIENLKKAASVPTASLFDEADITKLLLWMKNTQADSSGLKDKLTITSFVVWALSRAAAAFPLLNGVYQEEGVRLNAAVNVGLAIDRKEGLVVPVIREAQAKSLFEIAHEIALLKQRVQENKLTLEDLRGGTITLTNFGMGGARFGLPLLNYPEIAIVGLGKIQKKAAVFGGEIKVRDFLPLSLTFDHRPVDGMYASYFLKELKTILEEKAWP
ncbi:MAG: dihydrolipoamide acetyltransferase family protein, partial [Parachlamydiales bacterium]